MGLAPLWTSLAGADQGGSTPLPERRQEPGAPGPSHHGLVAHLEGDIVKVQPFLTRYGYAALFLAVLVEGFGIPAPGQTLLMAASIDAAQGRLSMIWVFAFALSAAVFGNTIGYAIGRWGGRHLLKRLRIQESRISRTERRFARSGPGLLIVARFFDGLRQLNGIAAGLLKMPWPRFALWNALGAGLWTGVWGLGIYFLGKKMVPVHHFFSRMEPVIVVLFIAAAASLLLYLLWQRRGKKSLPVQKKHP